MKKTVFTVIMAVIFVMLFASCGWDIEIINPLDFIVSSESGSSETSEDISKSEQSEETPESDPVESVPFYEEGEKYSAKSVLKEDAEEFLKTEEAFDYIKLFTSRAGHLDFEKTKDIVSSNVLFWFGEEIFEEAGEDSLSDDGNFIEVKKSLGDKYIKKYFGIDYSPEESDFGFDRETGIYKIPEAGGKGRNKFLSCEIYMTGGNEVRCSILMEGASDEIGKQFIISEMTFSVMEDEEGKYLRLRSNKVTDIFREASFEEQAKCLTKQVVEQIGKEGFSGGVLEINNERAIDFIRKMQTYVNMGNGFNRNSPYIGEFYRDDEGYHFPASSMKKVAKEVFGIGNLEIASDGYFKYDKKEKEYVSVLDKEDIITSTAGVMETYISGNTYIVRFTLFTLETEDDREVFASQGEYKMTFELINGTYLKYSGLDKA